LIIRRAQLQRFEDAAVPEFEALMVTHLARFSPLHSVSLGDAGIRTLIRDGVARAAPHGFTARSTVRFYIECMVLLGADFDTDPQYAWARPILADVSVPEVERADRLHDALMAYVAFVGGPDRAYAKRALREVKSMPLRGIPRSVPDFRQKALEQLAAVHPEKAAFLGSTALLALVARAEEEAQKWGVATDEGIALFIGLMYALGHGFVDDPKYPWIKGTLSRAAFPDPARRVERLYSKVMTYLDHVLLHIGG
jgi:hypothetical protein